MRARNALAQLAVTFTVAGCGPAVAIPPSVSVPPVGALPPETSEVTAMPDQQNSDCDTEASLHPGPLPPPGAMPPDSTMAAIAERGRLIVGVDQNSSPFGSRNPSTGNLEGFDIDVAHEMARAIFGDPAKIDLRVLDATQRESALMSGQVDIVVRTYSITCDRKLKVDFSTTYYLANQKILVLKGSGIDSAAALAGKRVCAVRGTTSLSRLFTLDPRPRVFATPTWTDCLVMLQQGQVDAISTDDAVLAGLVEQDESNVEMVGDSMGIEPYGVGIAKKHDDLVRFVNGVLEQMRTDGTWERLYDNDLRERLGPSPGPPPPRYQD